MKKKIISTIITATLLTTTLLPAISVSADPGLEFDKDTQNKYSEIQSKYNELENKIQGLDDQISLLICKIDSNNQEIDNVNKEIDNTKKEIEQKKEDIAEQEEVLGKRLREIYKSGGQNTYISLIFSAKSLGDLILKIDDTVKLVNGAVVMVETYDGGYTLEASIPLAELGLKVPENADIFGDLGFIFSDEAGKGNRARMYYYNNNSEVGLNSDIPSEARLYTNHWGKIKFNKQ